MMYSAMQDSKAAREMFDILGSMKKKAYIPEWMARQYCPNAEIVYRIEPDMFSFEIMYDSVEKFFIENIRIKTIYVDSKNNLYDPDGYLPQIVDHSTYIICCSFL